MLTFPLKQTTEYARLLNGVGRAGEVSALFGVPQIARAQILAALAEDAKRPVIAVCAGEAEATRFAEDLNTFGIPAEVFPARDFTLRPVEGQNREYEYRRLSVLGNLVSGRTKAVCVPAEAALQHTLPRDEFVKNTLTIKYAMDISPNELITRLYEAGYIRRFQVEGPGQFAVRGGIVDLYAPDMQTPHRIEFWGDSIDSIHTFDLMSQRREKQVKKIYLSPAREVLFGSCEKAAVLLRESVQKSKSIHKKQLEACMQADLELLDAGTMPTDTDKYLRLRYSTPGTVFEYCDAPIIMLSEPSAIRDNVRALEFRFGEECRGLLEEGVLAPQLTGFYEDMTHILRLCEKHGGIACENFTRTMPELHIAETVSAPAHALSAWGGEVATLKEDLRPLVNQDYAVAVLAGTPRAAAALAKDLTADGFNAAVFEKAPDDVPKGLVAVMAGHLSAGVEYPFARFAVITSRKHNQESEKGKPKKAKNKGLSSLSDIKAGDYVVHQNHGIGVYVGIQRLDLQGVVKDYIKISYEKGDTLYVPVTQLDVISRYTAPGDGEKVKLSKLGGDAWVKTKSRVRKATQEMAKELIELYAKRERAQGFPFPEDGDWQRDFETRFEYDETQDQLTSTAEIKKDMERPHPMDRLLCGDVGVGKTEVALRAAFKCVMGGKQCAILVPTTILAWQHYNTLLSRMEAFPVKIALLSRYRTAKQKAETIKQLANGTVDVVVGTHSLLQKSVKFNNLGLVIIDEEQRFGVKHKERLKETFIGVDMLTLSATPIPRTLNMALSGLRDMSTIEEPPIERRPIETYVLEHDEMIIAEALKKELARGGQAYYIHNRIDTIDASAERLGKLVEGARIATAHGRMNEEELSSVWQKLLDGDIDILVCTTLIETGVDVRNCNTLVIEDADKMGLAQLYQIRGRVGRSGRKAYAYFTFKRDRVLTDIASKRLSAIREFTSFGSGFRIAMRDLQIRGAGSLLGQSQHGHMESVGYDMYVKLLNQAIAEEKGEVRAPDKSDCLLDIAVDAYIPENYIADAAARIEAYKRIAAIQTADDADDVRDELTDRYGDLPKSAEGLIDISLVRIVAAQRGIYEITQKKDAVLLYSDKLDIESLKPLLKDMGRRLMLNASGKPYLSVRIFNGEAPLTVVRDVVEKMK
ncbi:MAG: transcription-repair coupling factor [Clostridia bacterium]|nr:transcription-repair coupling factor [Clostridia bacterium]